MEKNYHVYAVKEQALLQAVGAAVSRWANLEAQILELASWALQMNLRDAAHILSKFKTSALVLDFTQAMCRARIEDRKFLNSLFDLIREVSGDRNFLAHTIVSAHGGDPLEADWADAEPQVGPSTSSYLTETADKREPMNDVEVREILADTQFLVESIMGFTNALRSTPSSLPEKHHKPIQPRRPRLAERRGSGDKARASQRRSSQE